MRQTYTTSHKLEREVLTFPQLINISPLVVVRTVFSDNRCVELAATLDFVVVVVVFHPETAHRCHRFLLLSPVAVVPPVSDTSNRCYLDSGLSPAVAVAVAVCSCTDNCRSFGRNSESSRE